MDKELEDIVSSLKSEIKREISPFFPLRWSIKSTKSVPALPEIFQDLTSIRQISSDGENEAIKIDCLSPNKVLTSGRGTPETLDIIFEEPESTPKEFKEDEKISSSFKSNRNQCLKEMVNLDGFDIIENMEEIYYINKPFETNLIMNFQPHIMWPANELLTITHESFENFSLVLEKEVSKVNYLNSEQIMLCLRCEMRNKYCNNKILQMKLDVIFKEGL